MHVLDGSTKCICRHVIDAVLAAPPRLGNVRLLAVDGPSGAGKTTFAVLLRDEFRARGVHTVLIPTDDFATWERPVSWWPELADGVLDPVARGEPGGYRAIDWSTGEPRVGQWVTIPVPGVLIIEGVSAGRASVRPRLSHLCWVPGPEEQARLERSAARDGTAAREHLRAWQRFERGWFATDRTDQHADSRVVNTFSVSK